MVKQKLFFTGPEVVTVIGMAKNAGKTTTLNYLLKNSRARLGITSVGMDGESTDSITKLPKPSIYVQAGTIVATAEGVIQDAGPWDYLQETPIRTPLGKVVVIRAKIGSKIIVAGPGKNEDMMRLLAAFAAWKTEKVIIDGAFDRKSSADPSVSSQIILATGATLSRDMRQLIDITKCRVEQLTIPECRNLQADVLKNTMAKIVLAKGCKKKEIAVKSALLCRNEWLKLLEEECETVAVKGAVGDGLAGALLALGKSPAVVVQNGSKIFISTDLWKQLKVKNIHFSAVFPIRLLGVTINPSYPGEAGFEPDDMLAKVGSALAPVPVMDVARGAKY
jgi:hypothetical protein